MDDRVRSGQSVAVAAIAVEIRWRRKSFIERFGLVLMEYVLRKRVSVVEVGAPFLP